MTSLPTPSSGPVTGSGPSPSSTPVPPVSSPSVWDVISEDPSKVLKVAKAAGMTLGPTTLNLAGRIVQEDVSDPKKLAAVTLASITTGALSLAGKPKSERGVIKRALVPGVLGFLAVNSVNPNWIDRNTLIGAGVGAAMGVAGRVRDGFSDKRSTGRDFATNKEDYKNNYLHRVDSVIQDAADRLNNLSPGHGDEWLKKQEENKSRKILHEYTYAYGYSPDLLERFNSPLGKAYQYGVRAEWLLKGLGERFSSLSPRKKVLVGGLGLFATAAEISNFLNRPKGGFNHLTAAASAFAVSGLVYGASKGGEWYGRKTDDEKRLIKRRAALAGIAVVAIGGSFAAYKGWIPRVGGKSGNHLSDHAGASSTTQPKGGSTTTTLGERISTTTSAPNGSTSSTFTSTTVPSSVPRGGSGSALSDIGSRMPNATPKVSVPGGRSGDSTAKIMAEVAVKRAARAQEHLAKLRAEKLGIKLNDEQAKKLIERRFSNLFSGKSENFDRFVNSSDKAKQAFTDFDLKQAAA